MVLRLHASALGIPYLPARVLRAGDVAAASARVAEIECPFTGEHLAAIPALTPDVALVHAQRADDLGNVQMWGIAGDTVTGALASHRILATVEEVVSRDVVREDPGRTVIPGYRVRAVCPVPWGAHPSYVQGYYTRDDAFYRAYDEFSRTPEGLQGYLDEWVFGVADRAEYAARLDTAPLLVDGAPAPPVVYGFDRR
jgi:glutaconate CoA-transferase subunit A